MKLEWDKAGERQFETGVSKTVLYPQSSEGTYPKGVAWNGVTAITESPSGAEPTALWADNMKYGNLMSAEEFAATIEAYMYPDEFKACNGEASLAGIAGITIGQQKRQTFGLSYQTLIGNDIEGDSLGYNIHLIYGCLAAPSERNHQTVNDSPEAETMSWEVSTTPVNVKNAKPTAHLTINSTTLAAEKLTALEAVLYGSESEEARLPLPDEIVTIAGSAVAVG